MRKPVPLSPQLQTQNTRAPLRIFTLKTGWVECVHWVQITSLLSCCPSWGYCWCCLRLRNRIRPLSKKTPFEKGLFKMQAMQQRTKHPGRAFLHVKFNILLLATYSAAYSWKFPWILSEMSANKFTIVPNLAGYFSSGELLVFYALA